MPSNNTATTVTKHVIRCVVERGDEPQDSENVMRMETILTLFFVLITLRCFLALCVELMMPDSSDDAAVDEETKPGYISF